MSRRKARLLVVVELDDIPGTMHTAESALQTTQNILFQRMGHYNPRVSFAPAPIFDPQGTSLVAQDEAIVA